VPVTTIAWDGKTLAGDKQRSFRFTPLSVTKVFRLEPPKPIGNVPNVTAFGCAGDSTSAIKFEQWSRDGGDKPMLKDLDIVLIDADGSCWVGDHDLAFTRVLLPHWAIGSGADYALGAMARGATAQQAVDIASTFDTGTGMGVDEVALA
jgi:hypothetical protein